MSSFKEAKPHTQLEPVNAQTPTFEQVKTALVFLTPLIAPLSGFVTAWVGRHFPGITVDQSQTTDLFLGGIAAAVFAIVTLVLKDRKLTAIPGELEHFAVGEVGKLPDAELIEQMVKSEIATHLPELKTDAADIEAAIEAKLPPAVRQAVQGLLQQLGNPQAPAASGVQTAPAAPVATVQ